MTVYNAVYPIKFTHGLLWVVWLSLCCQCFMGYTQSYALGLLNFHWGHRLLGVNEATQNDMGKIGHCRITAKHNKSWTVRKSWDVIPCECIDNSWDNQTMQGLHDDVIKWKHMPCYWPFVQGIHRSPHKGQWRGALMFSLICAWINGRVNNGEIGDLRRHRTHYYVTLMVSCLQRCLIISYRQCKYNCRFTVFIARNRIHWMDFLRRKLYGDISMSIWSFFNHYSIFQRSWTGNTAVCNTEYSSNWCLDSHRKSWYRTCESVFEITNCRVQHRIF